MNDLLKSDKQNIWHPFTPLVGADDPIFIKSASGVYLHTHDDKKILDAISSWWVNIHGHAHPEIAKAIADQAMSLEHVIFAGFTHEPAIRLSENLLTILPNNQKKIFFSDNGSTAVEVAIKIACQYWFNKGEKRKTIVALKGAYHGDTFGAMSVGERSLFTNPFNDYLFNTHFIDFPDGTNEDLVFDQFRTVIQKGNVGAFIFEPLLQGAAGMRIYKPDILDKMISFAHQHKVVCIADEVLTGFGRTGKLFACDHLINKPDIMAISKGITGGTLPLGVTSCSGNIVSGFETDDFSKTFFHGHSYTANPLSCAAANASFKLLMTSECQSRIDRVTAWNKTFISQFEKNDKVRNARSIGTVMAIELKTEQSTGYNNSFRKKIYPYFMQRGILLRPLGNIIYTIPPYVITKEQLNEIGKAIIDFIEDEI
jgi:adenosylmethionine-8-amino-7-oxononanoate aminotransferase